MRRKISIIKGIVAIAICSVMVFQTSTYSEAALLRYSVRYANCPNCNSSNQSYGCDEHWGWQWGNANAGTYCPACGHVVANGERHTFQQETEIYYYICESPQCERRSFNQRKYSRKYTKEVYSDHRVTRISN